MANNLAEYFANQNQNKSPKSDKFTNTPPLLGKNSNRHPAENAADDDDMGPSVSMAVEADDDDSFERSTYNLKRTRSMGLFDDYVDPTKKLLGKSSSPVNQNTTSISTNNDDDGYDVDYNSDSDSDSSDSDDNSVQDYDAYDQKEEDGAHSPSVSPPPADTDNFLLPQDDNDLLREPERHVDYLSHEWNESEISNSWKYIILKKKKRALDLVNAARLENASWRTWAKARNGLKTVSPEVVNWSKDSDVTWLYGPIVRDNADEANDSIQLGYGSDDETSKRVTAPKKKSSSKGFSAPKPILKKRTVSEILKENALWKLSEARKHMNEMKHVSVVMDPNGSLRDSHDDYDDYDALAAKVNAQYYQTPRKNATSINTNNDSNKSSNTSNNDQSQAGGNMGQSQIRHSYSGEDVTHHIQSPSMHNTEEQVYQQQKLPQDQQLNIHKSDNETVTDDDVRTQVTSPDNNGAVLSSILASSKDNNIGRKPEKTIQNRHIHFNDRVEQCMAIKSPSDSDFSDGEEQEVDEVDDETNSLDNRTNEIPKNSGEKIKSVGKLDLNAGDTPSSDEDDDEDDEDNAGLFINPTISRRADSCIHYPATDSSSQNSSIHSRHLINPIIKLLPATTLNYGSDDEASDNSEFNGNYGNAVSHNVNTYRGYDYMYDYNSVYTGDTSSFLPVDNCDVVDLPEGIDLHSAIAADNASSYDLSHAVASGTKVSHQKSPPTQPPAHNFLRDDDENNSSSDSEEQFIENSQYRSSDDDEDGLALKRTISLGKSGKSNSLRDLTKPSSTASLNPTQNRSFISGKPLVSAKDNPKVMNSPNMATKTPPVNTPTSKSRPLFVKRTSSSSNFIFNSDSEDDDNEAKDDAKSLKNGSGNEGDNLSHGQISRARSMPLKDNGKAKSAQNTMISPASSVSAPSTSPQGSDLAKSIKIKHSSSPAEVGPSAVAISGSFSPRYGTVKSVASDKGIVEKHQTNDMREVNKNLKACHLDDATKHEDGHRDEALDGHGDGHEGSNESLQTMMQNARDIAHKYLHSWKKPNVKQGGQSGDRLENN